MPTQRGWKHHVTWAPPWFVLMLTIASLALTCLLALLWAFDRPPEVPAGLPGFPPQPPDPGPSPLAAPTGVLLLTTVVLAMAWWAARRAEARRTLASTRRTRRGPGGRPRS